MAQFKTTGPSRQRSQKKGWLLRLYVAGETARSVRTLRNLKRICQEYVSVPFTIEVIDLLKNPRLAVLNQIVALPTLIGEGPDGTPLRLIGDLSDTEKVLTGLRLRP